MAIAGLLAGASSVLQGAGGMGGLTGGGGGETSSAAVTQTLSTGPMGGGIDQNTLLIGALIVVAALVLWPKNRR